MVDFAKALERSKARTAQIDSILAGGGKLTDPVQHHALLRLGYTERLDLLFKSYSALPQVLLGSDHSESDVRAALEWVLKQLEMAEKHRVRMIPIGGREYPSLLNGIPDQPKVLYVRGDFDVRRKKCAVVGTREPTIFGRTVTKRVVQALVERGVSIVSGLALGIDGVAHEAALEAGGHTIAVVPNSLEDSVYPKQHVDLAKRILDAGGAIVSETPFFESIDKSTFVRRNRIQSGLSSAVFVAQTDVTGGTMHTVRHAVMQGRPVFVPFPPGDHATADKSQGLLALTQERGRELARILKADVAYEQAIEAAGVPIATALRSKEDYPRLFEAIGC